MAAELEETSGLEPRQVAALEKLHALGEGPAPKDEDGKSIYSSDSQVRALQLVYEGRLGGAGRGQGRKRKPRVGEFVAEEMRKRAGKIVDAIDRGLDSDSEKIALSAAEMAVKIDRDEAALQLREEEVDNTDNMSKEDLVATLIQLASAPSTAAQLEAVIDLPETEFEEVEVVTDDRKPRAAKRARTPANPKKARANARSSSGNGRGSAPRDRQKGGNPFTALAGGRAAD